MSLSEFYNTCKVHPAVKPLIDKYAQRYVDEEKNAFVQQFEEFLKGIKEVTDKCTAIGKEPHIGSMINAVNGFDAMMRLIEKYTKPTTEHELYNRMFETSKCARTASRISPNSFEPKRDVSTFTAKDCERMAVDACARLEIYFDQAYDMATPASTAIPNHPPAAAAVPATTAARN